ncbi:MAG: hypothetical protein GWP37_08245 [Gammaproteobacteria bacterium]|nr:hypothetical protein [Gammaproteobacteria bacterium]
MTQHKDQRGGRTILLLIAGLPVTMILAATWLWYFVERGDIDIVSALGTANSGEILANPVNIRSQSFTANDGSVTSLDALEPKWTFMVVNSGETCDTACSELLYLTRQIRIAIGRDFHRIQRVMLVDAPSAAMTIVANGAATYETRPLKDIIESEHPDVLIWQVGAEPIVPEQHLAERAWYLVDPSGWVMMRYASEVDYKDVISDLKFLLKNSGG